MGGLFASRKTGEAKKVLGTDAKSNLSIPTDDDKGGMKANQYSQVGKSGNFRKKGNSNSGGRTVATPNSPKMNQINRNF